MSYQTYTLTKDDELILETQAATVDRAIDYFAIDYRFFITSDHLKD